MVSPLRAAPGFRTFARDDPERPHLQTQALFAFRWQFEKRGVPVNTSAFFLLLILADLVDSCHGQFYGSWEGLAAKYGRGRSWVFAQRAELERRGLIECVGRHPNRRLATWQVLPHLYELVSANTDTSTNSGESATVDGDRPHPRMVLVSAGTHANTFNNNKENI